MEDRWFLAKGNSATGPHSLEQLRTMLACRQLNLTDMVLKEGESVPIPLSAVPGLVGSAPAPSDLPAPLPPPTRGEWRRFAAVLAATAGLTLIVSLVVRETIWDDAEAHPRANPNLPEWFDPAYRISKKRGIVFPPKTPQSSERPAAEPRGKYTEPWLDEHFTHYVGPGNAFIWASPRMVYPCDGKILSGIKVIVGEQAGDLTLICTLKDGQPENMYIQTRFLLDRSHGPPPVPDDD